MCFYHFWKACVHFIWFIRTICFRIGKLMCCETLVIMVIELSMWTMVLSTMLSYIHMQAVWYDLNHFSLIMSSILFYLYVVPCFVGSSSRHTSRGSYFFLSRTLEIWLHAFLLHIRVLSSNTKKGEIERTFYVSLIFCVLDVNPCDYLIL